MFERLYLGVTSGWTVMTLFSYFHPAIFQRDMLWCFLLMLRKSLGKNLPCCFATGFGGLGLVLSLCASVSPLELYWSPQQQPHNLGFIPKNWEHCLDEAFHRCIFVIAEILVGQGAPYTWHGMAPVRCSSVRLPCCARGKFPVWTPLLNFYDLLWKWHLLACGFVF